MLLSGAEMVFMSFILYLSGDHAQESSLCALKGSSVNLSCSDKHLSASMNWYTINETLHMFLLKELSPDGNSETYNRTEESNSTLTIKDLRESDAKSYCCSNNTDNPELCWGKRTELHVADLQVKVIPTTEGQTVTLMCSTSCPLTENPAAYIWFKNREFLYEDWSPWYQELISSDKAVTYSCAIKGYDDLRAPEVSVDSITASCVNVTYAKGRMCFYQLKSADEPCSIAYPRVIRVQKTPVGNQITLTCDTSCPMGDHTAYKWYWNRELYRDCESKDITVSWPYDELFSCTIKTHEELLSDEICIGAVMCSNVNFVSRRICALEGSSLNISSNYSHPQALRHYKLWYKRKRHGEGEDAETLVEATGRVEYHDYTESHHMLRINDLKKNDSAEYVFKLQTTRKYKHSDVPGVMLVVTGLKVTITPQEEVTEGQRVTMTCSTSCPLTDNTSYIWYLNRELLTQPENKAKHLVLDPVSSQHTGNYSCAVNTPLNISSPERALIVKAQGTSVAMVNAVKLTVLLLMLLAVLLLYLILRKKLTVTITAELSDKLQTGQMAPLYEISTLGPESCSTKRTSRAGRYTLTSDYTANCKSDI